MKCWQRLIACKVELRDGEKILRCPIKSERRSEIITDAQKDNRHDVHHLLLRWIASFRRKRHLPNHCASHDDRQKINGIMHEMRDGVWLREIGDPEKMAVAEFNGCSQHAIEAKENGNLNNHRKASAKRINAILFVELHQLFVHFCWIVFILCAELRHARRKKLHAAHRVGGLILNRPEKSFDQQC